MDEYSVQSPGFISRLRNRLSQLEQRTAFDAFLILLIVVGLIATVYLAGQRQIFRSRASQDGSADVVNEQGQALPKNEDGSVTVEAPQIRLKIDFPTNWSQSLLPEIINPAYGQTSCPDQCFSDQLWLNIRPENESCTNTNLKEVYACPGAGSNT